MKSPCLWAVRQKLLESVRQVCGVCERERRKDWGLTERKRVACPFCLVVSFFLFFLFWRSALCPSVCPNSARRLPISLQLLFPPVSFCLSRSLVRSACPSVQPHFLVESAQNEFATTIASRNFFPLFFVCLPLNAAWQLGLLSRAHREACSLSARRAIVLCARRRVRGDFLSFVARGPQP